MLAGGNGYFTCMYTKYEIGKLFFTITKYIMIIITIIILIIYYLGTIMIFSYQQQQQKQQQQPSETQ